MSWSAPQRSDRPAGRLARLGLVALALGALGACFNSHVFDIIDSCEVDEEVIDVEIEPTKAADILIVVDNSGSMCEEQANLVENFFNDNSDECPIAGLSLEEFPERYINPQDTVVRDELSECGFIQILSAYENDFRVGVITTDIGLCDNRYGLTDVPTHPNNCDGEAKPDWGRRPQRGCLQAPADWDQKFLDKDSEDIGARFEAILDGVQTFGSAFERGLDATQVFLSQDAPHPDCESDRDEFLRDDASLLVIYLTDEDDCSHQATDDFPDETEYEGDSCDTPYADPGTLNPELCYTEPDLLTPVDEYVSFLQSIKGPGADVRLAVIAGGLNEPGQGTVSAGCLTDPDAGTPDGLCTPSRGGSNVTIPGQFCDPERLADAGLPPCCQADPGNRYYDLAERFEISAPGKTFTDSICFASFRQTMIQLAQFAGQVNRVNIGAPPQYPEAMIVEILRSGDAQAEEIERIPDGADPTDRDGWQLSCEDGDCKVQFYGTVVPQPGDEISVRSLRDSTASTDEAQCVGFSSSSDADAGN